MKIFYKIFYKFIFNYFFFKNYFIDEREIIRTVLSYRFVTNVKKYIAHKFTVTHSQSLCHPIIIKAGVMLTNPEQMMFISIPMTRHDLQRTASCTTTKASASPFLSQPCYLAST